MFQYFSLFKNYFFPTLKKIKVQVQEEGFYQGLSEMERWPWQEGNWERPQSNQEILHRCSCDLPHPTAIVAKTSKEGTNYSFNMSKRPLFLILLPLFLRKSLPSKQSGSLLEFRDFLFVFSSALPGLELGIWTDLVSI